MILDWSMPANSYTHLGTFLWLAYPIFSMACCLDLAWGDTKSLYTTYLLMALLTSSLQSSSVMVMRPCAQVVEYTMFVPTIMYGWCELAYLVHILDKWTEPRHDVNFK